MSSIPRSPVPYTLIVTLMFHLNLFPDSANAQTANTEDPTASEEAADFEANQAAAASELRGLLERYLEVNARPTRTYLCDRVSGRVCYDQPCQPFGASELCTVYCIDSGVRANPDRCTTGSEHHNGNCPRPC